MSDTSTNRYTSGEYLNNHADWHLVDSPGKVQDIMPAMSAIVKDTAEAANLSVVDIGAGAGGVLHELTQAMSQAHPATKLDLCGFEIAKEAIEMAQEKFPNIYMRNEFFTRDSGNFDAALLIDVLEHLENPWDMLRVAAHNSKYLVVRQPLIANYSNFRHRNYSTQREHWGHIAYFNFPSFMDMADACGWKPIYSSLLPPWELKAGNAKSGFLKSLLVRMNRFQASHFLSGFYLIGAFVRKES